MKDHIHSSDTAARVTGEETEHSGGGGSSFPLLPISRLEGHLPSLELALLEMGTPQGPPLQQLGFPGVGQAQPVVDPATLPPLLPVENLVPPMPPKNKGGRPKSDFWAYFTEQGELRGKTNRKAATCNFCGWAIGDARVDTLARHITSECKKVRLLT